MPEFCRCNHARVGHGMSRYGCAVSWCPCRRYSYADGPDYVSWALVLAMSAVITGMVYLTLFAHV